MIKISLTQEKWVIFVKSRIIKTINPWVKYLYIDLNQPPPLKEFFLAPPDRKILDPYPSVDMVPPAYRKKNRLRVLSLHFSARNDSQNKASFL